MESFPTLNNMHVGGLIESCAIFEQMILTELPARFHY
jgi:hypothetical protein